MSENFLGDDDTSLRVRFETCTSIEPAFTWLGRNKGDKKFPHPVRTPKTQLVQSWLSDYKMRRTSTKVILSIPSSEGHMTWSTFLYGMEERAEGRKNDMSRLWHSINLIHFFSSSLIIITGWTYTRPDEEVTLRFSFHTVIKPRFLSDMSRIESANMLQSAFALRKMQCHCTWPRQTTRGPLTVCLSNEWTSLPC